MNIDFSAIEPVVNVNFKGGEGNFVVSRFVNDPLERVMRGHLEPGASLGYHTHETNSEIIYILAGEGTMRYDGGEEPLLPGTVNYCPMGHSHSMVNTGTRNLEFLAVVTEHA